METSKKIGAKLRKLRQEKGWTIEDLSFECGVNRNYLGDLERGKRNPTINIMVKIIKVFDITLSEFFDEI